jgi:Flp pilus assembly protein TadD
MVHNRIVLLARVGRLDAALDAARDFVAIAPDDPRAWLDLGVLLARAGRTADARQAFEEGLRRHPDNPDLRANRARLD